METVVKLHGPSNTIVSDRDKKITSNFWKDLFKLLDTKLHMSTTYHPWIDGQSERVNQCLDMYLRCVVHDTPTKWHSWLPLAEFWYNTNYHTSLAHHLRLFMGTIQAMGSFLHYCNLTMLVLSGGCVSIRPMQLS